MTITEDELKCFLNTLKKYDTIREGASDFRLACAKNPRLDKASFAAGYESGIYYAIAVMFGTEWIDNYLNKEEE